MSLRFGTAPGGSHRARAGTTVLLALSCWAAACGRTSSGGAPDALSVHGDGAADVSCQGGEAGRMANGQACGCAADCASGFCADGVCCDTACTDTCRSCNVPGAPGVCTFVPAGSLPSSPAACPKSDVATCGLDGTCDGQGSCRQFPAGSICQAGACQSGAVVGTQVCDGAGRCEAGPQTICAPFNCDATTGQCFPACRSDADCVPGVKCVGGSCGPKPQAAVCTKGSECASGFCADGVCCNVACSGACVSCNQPARQGTCWPVEAGTADPHKTCRDEGKAGCGQTGTCDGLGGCALYKVETICGAPFCGGDNLTTAGTCDGLGTCRMPVVETCAPYRCSGGACMLRCSSDADCVAGQSCHNGSCGPKPNGQACTAVAACASGFCVDGVCCNSACTGNCRSCALPSALGTCSPVSAGANDPRGVCTDQGAASCGSDGKCDGAGACRKYKTGTVCAAEHCANDAYTGPSTCDASAHCVAPASNTCAPFACNGGQCFNACTSDANCAAGNSCIGNSCGKAGTGAACSTNSQCGSGICAQGVCCASACTGACRSCALAGSAGQCKPVPAGAPDPAGSCLDKGAASCSTDGKCDGAGACQLYASGTACKGASCPAGGNMFTAASTCNGTGTCLTPVPTSCGAFTCGTSGCKSICGSNADCLAPAVCTNGSCGLKANGAGCGAGTECLSGICAEGVCCGTACSGRCMSCALSGQAGTCAMVLAGGADPSGTCKDQGAATCGNNGFCDGLGACQAYPTGTACGTGGTCQAGACKVLSKNGTACLLDTECTSGHCTNGFCCGVASCGSCSSCGIKGSEGTCAPVAAGTADLTCPVTLPTSCGTTGTCDSAGKCAVYADGTACGLLLASCSTAAGGIATPQCSKGSCVSVLVTNCAPYNCDPVTNLCKLVCTNAADCAPGFSCNASAGLGLRTCN